jgi:hypothetical protein
VYDGNGRAYKNDSLHTPWQEGFIRDLCPYGQPGDRLWVRETCRAEEVDGVDGVRYVADNHFKMIENTREASDAWVNLYHYAKRRGASVPPIHAPRWVSRLLLEIVAVRCERLQNISEVDARDEGADRGLLLPYGIGDWQLELNQWAAHKTGFQYIWYKINGPESWAANPWVWVVKFKIIQPSL